MTQQEDSQAQTHEMPAIPAELAKAQKLAQLLDTSFRLPVVGYRVGLDGIIGLLPVVGDLITTAIALRIILLARQLGMPGRLIKKMLRNLALDFIIGVVPVIGSIADFFYKANRRNVKLMEKWWFYNHEQELKKSTGQSVDSWVAANFID